MRHLTTHRYIDLVARTGSIRSAAQRVHQTPSAVQRRIQSYEDELGFPIFERSTTGVRLTSAGELVIQHIREMLAETERLKSRVADLAGMRRGHVNIGCSQAMAPYFLPDQIAHYQSKFPQVTFNVSVMEHDEAGPALEACLIDLALVFDKRSSPNYKILQSVPQRLSVLMRQGHPLASIQELRLRQCFEYPVILPVSGFGGRALVDRAIYGKGYAAAPILESNSFEYLKAHVARTDALSFQVEIGAPSQEMDAGITGRKLDERDIEGGVLLFSQKEGRLLPVAASRFLEQVSKALVDQFGEP